MGRSPQNQLPGTGRASGCTMLHPLWFYTAWNWEACRRLNWPQVPYQACAMAGAAPKEGALFSNFPKSFYLLPATPARLHLPRGDAFFWFTQRISIGYWQLCAVGVMGDGEWKEENKRLAGTWTGQETGTGICHLYPSPSLWHSLPTPQEPRAPLFLLCHDKPALRFLICTTIENGSQLLKCCFSWRGYI